MSPSCQAAIKRLDVVPGYRMNTELPSPRIHDTGHRTPRATRFCASSPTSSRAWPTCCLRCPWERRWCEPRSPTPTVRTPTSSRPCGTSRRAARRPWPRSPTGCSLTALAATGLPDAVADLLDYAEVKDVDWSDQPNMLGASRSTSRRTTTSAAACSTATSKPVRRTRLAHQHLPLRRQRGASGGWVEGAAMSAINAVVGVCSQIESKAFHLRLADRFRPCSSPTSGSSTTGRTSADERRARPA